MRVPVVAAPMAGGPSTPALVTAVLEAGGFAFLAAGYKSPEALRREIAAVRSATSLPFGVNLLGVTGKIDDLSKFGSFLELMKAEAELQGVTLGEPSWSDDQWSEKFDVVLEARPAVVSFAWGPPDGIEEFRRAGIETWASVTEPWEAERAQAAGVDALVVQGFEAGGHRGSIGDFDGEADLGLLSLLRLVARKTDLPLIASGGLCDGYAVAAALVAGAKAAQLGTAFLDT
jgi:nitronate monooxygenase